MIKLKHSLARCTNIKNEPNKCPLKLVLYKKTIGTVPISNMIIKSGEYFYFISFHVAASPFYCGCSEISAILRPAACGVSKMKHNKSALEKENKATNKHPNKYSRALSENKIRSRKVRMARTDTRAYTHKIPRLFCIERKKKWTYFHMSSVFIYSIFARAPVCAWCWCM